MGTQFLLLYVLALATILVNQGFGEVITCARGNGTLTLKGNSTVGNSPDTNVTDCTFNIQPIVGSNQIKVDFIELNLDAPYYDSCMMSTSVILMLNTKTVQSFTICGNQLPSHSIYLTFLNKGETSIRVYTKIVPGNTFKFNVTYINDLSNERAPDQCLVILPNEFGIFKSFGYPKYMIANTYKACIVKAYVNDNFRWSECGADVIGNDVSPFLLSTFYTNENGSVKMSVDGKICTYSNYIELPGNVQQCGSSFMDTSSIAGPTNYQPYEITVQLNNDEQPYATVFLYPGNDGCPNQTRGFYACGVPVLNGRPMDGVCACPGKEYVDPPLIRNIGFCLRYYV